MKDEQDMVANIFKIVFGAFIVIMLLVVVFGTFYTISAGQRGLILTFGKPSMDAKLEGLHMKIPLVQKVIKMEVRTQKYEADLTAASKDLQDVNTKIAINYHIVPEKVPEIFRDIGTNYAEKIIYPYEQETNKGITSQFTAEELITKRENVREKMKSDLAEKLRSRGIIVEEVSIVNFAFSESFTQAIEQKVTAEQNALTAKNKLEQIKYEAQQVEAAAIGQKNANIATAQGNAEAIRIIDEQLKKSDDYIEYYKLQKWNGQLPQVTGGAVPFINLQ